MVKELSQAEQEVFRTTAMVLLKPDTLELVLENLFIRDFEALDLEVRYRQLLRLQRDDIPVMYPEHLPNKELFPYIVEYMASGESMLLVLKGKTPEDADLHYFVKALKGRANTPGLRSKYIIAFEAELKEKFPNPEEFLSQLCRNRIHSSEDGSETLKWLIYLWPRLDQGKMAVQVPELYNVVRSHILPANLQIG